MRKLIVFTIGIKKVFATLFNKTKQNKSGLVLKFVERPIATNGD